MSLFRRLNYANLIKQKNMPDETHRPCGGGGWMLCNPLRTLRKCISVYTISLRTDTAHLPQQCHNPKSVIFQERLLKVLKCYNFLWVQRRHNCSPAASFANCDMTLYLLKVHLQTFLSIPITRNFQILSCDTLVANERYGLLCSGRKK